MAMRSYERLLGAPAPVLAAVLAAVTGSPTEALAQDARELTGERPVVVWGAGKVGKPFARELIRQGVRVNAFVDLDPRKIGQSICGAPVLAPAQLGSLVRPYTLGAVGSPGAREEIRAELTRLGQVELEDFRMVA